LENELYIYHHGVKGQKWGVRRYQNEDGTLTSAGKARSKKNVKALYKGLTRTTQGSNLVSAATISKINPKDYETFTKLSEQGRLVTKATFKKNFKNESVDLYIGKEKTPTIRVKMKDGESYTAEFLDKNGAMNFSKYNEWYKKNRK
jgi:hypothetical protein